jgi:hypothetical protein
MTEPSASRVFEVQPVTVMLEITPAWSIRSVPPSSEPVRT